MTHLLKIEWRKIAPNKTFWILIILYAFILGSIFFGIQSFIENTTSELQKESSVKVPGISLYLFPDIWHNLAYLAGFFKIFLAFLMIILVTNEFGFKTSRQNIASGLSREQFMISKILVALLISLFAVLFLLICGTVLGLMNTTNISANKYFGEFSFVFAYFWEVFVYLTFAVLIGFLVRKSGFGIALLLIYLIVESIIVYRLPENWKRIMPLEALSNLIDVPNTALMKLAGINFLEYVPLNDLLISIGYWFVFMFAIYLIIKKSDL